MPLIWLQTSLDNQEHKAAAMMPPAAGSKRYTILIKNKYLQHAQARNVQHSFNSPLFCIFALLVNIRNRSYGINKEL